MFSSKRAADAHPIGYARGLARALRRGGSGGTDPTRFPCLGPRRENEDRRESSRASAAGAGVQVLRDSWRHPLIQALKLSTPSLAVYNWPSGPAAQRPSGPAAHRRRRPPWTFGFSAGWLPGRLGHSGQRPVRRQRCSAPGTDTAPGHSRRPSRHMPLEEGQLLL